MVGRPQAPCFPEPRGDSSAVDPQLRAPALAPPTARPFAILGPPAQSSLIAAMEGAGAVAGGSVPLGHQVPAGGLLQVGGAAGGNGRAGGPVTRRAKGNKKGMNENNNKGRNKPYRKSDRIQAANKGPLGPVCTPVHVKSVRKVGHLDLMASLRKRLISRHLSGGQSAGSGGLGGATGGLPGQLVSPCVAPTFHFVPQVAVAVREAQEIGVAGGSAAQGGQRAGVVSSAGEKVVEGSSGSTQAGTVATSGNGKQGDALVKPHTESYVAHRQTGGCTCKTTY
ncbi:uncharacterized protein LOC128643200 [Bombina bombina]|uniref:uncharacterized protein LOC128643200 n=1 Tax=Bombina bombina TaxID=8345 RepID=UPI00235A930F|nr:uncharacterized protein LOC128643200 [Bombina bombina]